MQLNKLEIDPTQLLIGAAIGGMTVYLLRKDIESIVHKIRDKTGQLFGDQLEDKDRTYFASRSQEIKIRDSPTKLGRGNIVHKRIVQLELPLRIDCLPTSVQASFPYESITPYARQLNSDDLRRLLKLPEDIEIPSDFNEFVDCSSSPNGVCHTTRSLVLSNSHAGTHADQPHHFYKSPSTQRFPEKCYRGIALVLDLTRVIRKCRKNENAQSIPGKIMKAYLNQAQEAYQRVFSEAHKTSYVKLSLFHYKRVLLRTRSKPLDEQATPTMKFPYLSTEAMDELLNAFPSLLLLGVDTMSVDAPDAAPIAEHNHGKLFSKKVAILENLRLEELPRSINVGIINTLWNPLQDFDDSRGCMVQFFPY